MDIEQIALPTWLEADAALEEGKGTPLHTFIHSQEPCGDDEIQFRTQLQAVIGFVIAEAHGDLAAALQKLRGAFVIAVGDKSPFARQTLAIADEALAKAGVTT